MRKFYWRAAALSLLTGLAACGGGNNTSVPPVTPPVVVPPVTVTPTEDKFGTNFGIAYRGSKLVEATDPKAGDIIALSLTGEPLAI